MHKYIKSKSVIEYFDISMPTLNRWVKAGKIPKPTFINKQRYWSVEEIEQAVDKLMNK